MPGVVTPGDKMDHFGQGEKQDFEGRRCDLERKGQNVLPKKRLFEQL